MKKRERIRGMLLGVYVGDALGMPVETWDDARIAKTYGRVEKMLTPDGHKWFKGEPAGMMTDDTQLTCAVAQAMVDANGGLDMDAMARRHVEAMKASTKGWGNSTRESVRALANGASWSTSARGHGQGNGVPMKISPIAAYAFQSDDKFGEAIDFTLKLSQMTHKTDLAAAAALAQMCGLAYCLALEGPDKFNQERFIHEVAASSAIAEGTTGNFMATTESMPDLLELLYQHEDYDTPRIIEQFGGGACGCNFSIPFTHMFFVKNYMTIDSLYDVVNAGGDTDSNGSMLAALLGALHGPSIFP